MANIFEFSGKTRAANLAHFQEPFDILVVGGGITGSGIARDASMRGYRTALIDKGDFAGGTSSKSSKLVHGGIRYVELFEFGLVFEASRERRVLWQVAPDLVKPLPFLFPVYKDARWPAWMIDIGLWMYDGLALFRNYRRHRMYSNAQIKQLLPGIDIENIRGGAHYYDGQVDDARLTLESIRAAHRHGAVIANYVQVDGLLKENGRVVGVQVHDAIGGHKCVVRARVVVNATGPWTDTLLRLDDPSAPRRIRPTKGIHILVPRRKFGGDSAVAFPAHSDGRLMFVIPWEQFSIIGTTDTDYDGDYDQVHADRADVEYVLAAANHAFPEWPIGKSDIVSAFAGLRPLVMQVGKSATKTSREHEIWTTESGLVTIAGGKLTTYRSMAQELVDMVGKRLRSEFQVEPIRPCVTAQVPLFEPDGSVPENDLGNEVTQHLVHTHGPQFKHVLETVHRLDRYAQRVAQELPYVWGEVQYAIEQEMAMTVEDVLSRRLHLLWEAKDNGLAAAPEVAQYLGAYFEWDKTRTDNEITAYEQVVRRETVFRE